MSEKVNASQICEVRNQAYVADYGPTQIQLLLLVTQLLEVTYSYRISLHLALSPKTQWRQLMHYSSITMLSIHIHLYWIFSYTKNCITISYYHFVSLQIFHFNLSHAKKARALERTKGQQPKHNQHGSGFITSIRSSRVHLYANETLVLGSRYRINGLSARSDGIGCCMHESKCLFATKIKFLVTTYTLNMVICYEVDTIGTLLSYKIFVTVYFFQYTDMICAPVLV